MNNNKVGTLEYTQAELEEATKWNNNTSKYNIGGKEGKIMNKVEDEEDRSYLVNIWRLTWGVIAKTKFKNNSRGEDILTKLEEYLKKTTAV
jgi:hypothetical protein